MSDSPSLISPSSAPSSPPTRLSRVDLPAPDAPITATISPASTVNETPRSTSSGAPEGLRKAFRKPRTTKAFWILDFGFWIGPRSLLIASFNSNISQCLCRRDARRAVRRGQGCQQAEDKGDEGGERNVAGARVKGDAAERVNVCGEADEPVTVADETGDEPEQDAKERARESDCRPFEHKDAHDALRARAHSSEDGYVGASLDDDEHEHRRDVERRHHDDERDDEDAHASFERERGEQRAVRFLPVECRVFTTQLFAQSRRDLPDVVDVRDLYADDGGVGRRLTGKARGVCERDVNPRRVVLVEPGTKNARDLDATVTRRETERRQRRIARDQLGHVAHVESRARRKLRAQNHARHRRLARRFFKRRDGRAFISRALSSRRLRDICLLLLRGLRVTQQRLDRARDERASNFRQGARRFFIYPAQDGVSRARLAAQQRAVVSGRRRIFNPACAAHSGNERAPVRNGLTVPAHQRNMRRAAQDFVAHLITKTVGERQCDNQRSDAEGDTRDRRKRREARQRRTATRVEITKREK